MSILDATFFRDEEEAYSKLEAFHWPVGPECPHCGSVNDATKIQTNTAKKVRYGLWRCKSCKAQFTVTVGTVFESSHIPLHKWLQAAYLLNSSKKGISAKQIERTLQISYKSAWFMMHRLREAMTPAAGVGPIGGEGEIVEADETYIGHKDGTSPSNGYSHKRTVLSLVQRGGPARSFHIDKATKKNIMSKVRENVSEYSRFMTDEAKHYKGGYGVQHDTVNHGKAEYARGDVSTNTVEGFFSIFKRGFKGIYQHCGEKHLQRYLNEYDFRYNNREALGVNDMARTAIALQGAKGKRLTYRRTHAAQ